MKHTAHIQKLSSNNIQHTPRKIPSQTYALWFKDMPWCFLNENGPNSREMSWHSLNPWYLYKYSHSEKEHDVNFFHLMEVASDNGVEFNSRKSQINAPKSHSMAPIQQGRQVLWSRENPKNHSNAPALRCTMTTVISRHSKYHVTRHSTFVTTHSTT